MADLELSVDSGRAALASRFFQAGSDLIALLDELSELPVDWILTRLQTGSAIARISAPPGAAEGDAPLRSAVTGLKLARETDEALPPAWTPDAIGAARRFAHRFADDTNEEQGLGHLRLIVGSDVDAEVPMGSTLADRLDQLEPLTRTMPGAVRGKLVGLNVSRGNRASLKTPTGRVIRVSFGNDLRLQLKEALYQDVELRGQVRQDADGVIFGLRADEFSPVDPGRMRWTELFGFDPDITGSLSVTEYLEAARGKA